LLSIKYIRQNLSAAEVALKKRESGISLNYLIQIDEERRKLIQETELYKHKQNIISKSIPKLKSEGADVDKILKELKDISNTIKKMSSSLTEMELNLKNTLLTIPNIPDDSVPKGSDSKDNIEIRKWGSPTKFKSNAKPHWELAESLGIIDFLTAAKITGSRFSLYKGLGAKLERSLINLMLDIHINNGYTELLPPFIVNRESMIGTGQLPKFEEDAFKIRDTNYFLVPTAEVPVTNIHRDNILVTEELPIRYCAYTACFRAEAGSAGRDTKGLIRQHQFNKVELVTLTLPNDSDHELEKLTQDAEYILKLLNIPYRVMLLCGGDLGFSASKTYDIEVWMPSYNRYVEISSCSNFKDFQARRANIKYKQDKNDKARYVHTLNGSGLAVGRTLAAIIENYQQEDGYIQIPEPLQKYIGTNLIKPNAK
jgi:seryl-tRNA synthetase